MTADLMTTPSRQSAAGSRDRGRGSVADPPASRRQLVASIHGYRLLQYWKVGQRSDNHFCAANILTTVSQAGIVGAAVISTAHEHTCRAAPALRAARKE